MNKQPLNENGPQTPIARTGKENFEFRFGRLNSEIDKFVVNRDKMLEYGARMIQESTSIMYENPKDGQIKKNPKYIKWANLTTEQQEAKIEQAEWLVRHGVNFGYI